MSLHVDPSYLETVKEILKKYGIDKETYAFGSRVRGDHRQYSDLDLLLKRSSPLETRILVQLKNDFESSNLPITVDFIEWCKITEDFRKNIENDLELIK